MNTPLSYADAAKLVLSEAARLRATSSERVELANALGRVLAEPVVADRDQPPFPRSTRDGFTGRAVDWAGMQPLRVIGTLPAGERWMGPPLKSGECLEIMTGAPVPESADCVVMVEHVERSAEGVRLQEGRTIAMGANIVAPGAEARAGTSLLAAGTRLTPHGIGAAAICGYAQVQVFARPRVAVLATGDELVNAKEIPLPHQIRNSNSYSLAAQVIAAGAEARMQPIVRDTAQALEEAIRKARAECDLLLLSGGVSMGKYDLVEPALEALGGRFHFTGAAIQPGKPVVFGGFSSQNSDKKEIPFFGLPGNPVSTAVCFALFVAPVLAALGGERTYRHPFAQARLRGKAVTKKGLTRFIPAWIESSVDGATVEAVAWQGSGDLAATSRANCFLVVPDGPELLEDALATVLLA